MQYEVKLNYEQLLLLDKKVDAKSQAIIEKAKADHTFMNIGDETLSAIIGDALKCGKLEWTRREMQECQACHKQSSYVEYKSGPNKGRPNYDKHIYVYGISFQTGFISMKGYARFGYCSECCDGVLKTLKSFILEHNLPIELNRDADTQFIREDERLCFNCKKTMWEYDMGLYPAMMSGMYHAECPHCQSRQVMFGPSHSSTGIWRMAPIIELEKCGGAWRRKKN